MTIKNLLEKIKVIDTFSNYKFHILIGDSFGLMRFNYAGIDDKTKDFKTLKDLYAEIDKLYTLANNNLECNWWFE